VNAGISIFGCIRDYFGNTPQLTHNVYNIGYFTSDNEPDRIENETHNTLPKKSRILKLKYPFFFGLCYFEI
jgi:hypothetical protein